MKKKNNKVRVGKITVANDLPFVLIAGPDSLESWERTFPIVSKIKKMCDHAGVPYILKASYDKANRTSTGSFRGVGITEGLKLLARFREKLGVPITTDVHTPEEAKEAGKVVDLIQIPALLSRQTDLIIAAAQTGKPVNIKKGQFMAPHDMHGPIGKAESAGNKNILLTERGFSFGYHNLIVDMRGLEIMKETGYPVIFDAAHSVQLPSGGRETSAGERQFIFPLARAAAAVGVAGIFFEIYDDPALAPVDGPNSLLLKDLPEVLKKLKEIDKVVKMV
jgi:2-dehydro-3-deoxyphosphooctonate aldolase (KDO 8-P synthase)